MTKKQRAKITKLNINDCLQQLWHQLNKECFHSGLEHCPEFVICDTPNFLAAYSFKIKKRVIYDTKIIFSKKLFYQASQHFFLDALLHEMSHQYCVEVLGLPEEGHGKIWKMICQGCGATPTAKTHWVG